jgi:hypothetical protein
MSYTAASIARSCPWLFLFMLIKSATADSSSGMDGAAAEEIGEATDLTCRGGGRLSESMFIGMVSAVARFELRVSAKARHEGKSTQT